MDWHLDTPTVEIDPAIAFYKLKCGSRTMVYYVPSNANLADIYTREPL
jgi:hypothetical protein